MDDAIDRNIDRRPKGIPLRDIVELRLRGFNGAEIALQLGISKQAVSQRLKGLMGQLDGDKLDAYREHRVAALESLEEQLLSELVNPDRIQKATLGNVAYAFTQVHNARRLEAGESTQNIGLAAIVARVEADLKKSVPSPPESAD